MGHVQQRRLRKAQEILAEQNIPIWLMYSDEGSDPTIEALAMETKVPSILILTPERRRFIVNTLDADNIPKDEWGEDMVRYSQRDYHPQIVAALREFGFPAQAETIALNYTVLGNALTDRMGAGIRDMLDDLVKREFQIDRPIRTVLTSAELALFALYDRKDATEIEHMQVAARRANEILAEAFSRLSAGVKDWDAHRIVQEIMAEPKPDYFAQHGVTKEEHAWGAKYCPVVLTGESWTKGGHALTCGQTIDRGNTVYFDFGVKLTFTDGTSWCSDIQRMGYVLRDGETEAPEHVQRLFRTVYDSITAGINALRPGAKGHEVDAVVRGIINQAGHDYDHATGHPIGELTHNPGTSIRGMQPFAGPWLLGVQPNAVYTIEPRIPIVNGCSIEEMVLVNPSGDNQTLCPRQETLYLIK